MNTLKDWIAKISTEKGRMNLTPDEFNEIMLTTDEFPEKTRMMIEDLRSCPPPEELMRGSPKYDPCTSPFKEALDRALDMLIKMKRHEDLAA